MLSLLSYIFTLFYVLFFSVKWSAMGFVSKLIRRKFISSDSVENTELARCLNTLDLTALGMIYTLVWTAYCHG